ncbi:MAG: prolipoprotein diacylglyceryl transferase [Candidatus Pacebacteria bacterium]|nr:prolipoprotein diacylglyceryl transferase [Candidatus Paceibacterota bacterium]
MYPILFKVSNLSVESYWVFMALGFIIGGIVIYWQTKKRNLNPQKAKYLIIITIISAFIGSRLGYVFLNFSSYQKDLLKILQFWKGGFSWQGGFIAAFLITFFLVLKNDRENSGKWCDSYILGILIGHSIGRIGCFLNGCCYGIIRNVPWAIKFPNLGDNLLRHPTQLYEAFSYFLIFLLLYFYSKKIKLKNGSLFFIGATLHSLSRFIIEYFRYHTDFIYQGKIWYFTLNYAQLTALIIITISIFILFRINYKKKNLQIITEQNTN